ncbi:MAG: tetratricopeptide repeat protein [Paludibacteraceae bacterium]|jgi:Tfp pilus assembly protein PilF/outer membrane protein OmpA-like peptidoglycan-associated protein|nr:tetratricopeptide repeat protein [Paludibacteraceae bacterium]
MKKSLFFASVIAVAILTSCGTAVQPEQISVNPSPLVVVGNQVEAQITGTFPVKKFAKNAVLTVTPVLKYEGGEALGQSVVYVGEKAKENGQMVSYKEGGKYTQVATFDYVPQMAKSELYLRFVARSGNKNVEIPDVKIADGVVSTAKLVVATADEVKPQITADKFQRIIQEVQEADIRFLIQQSTLRNSELKSQEMKNLQGAIKDADTAVNKAINKIEVAGYASPDGNMELNTQLADARQEKAQKYLAKQLKKAKVNAEIESNVTAEDWAGFQKAMEASNIQDKELVLRVLGMYTDPEEREAQIKNLSAVYKTIADEILPALRRSRLILTTDLIGKSDDEIAALAKNDPRALNVDELLYAATLTQEAAEKINIYTKTAELFPADYRAYNNIGMVYFIQGEVANARRSFAKALQLAPNNPDVNYNAGISAMAENDLAQAEQYLGKAAGTQGDLKAAMGTLYTMKGDYSAAKTAYGKEATNNAAVQQILNEDYAAARQTLARVAKPNATTAYLAAVVGARTNDRDAVYGNLKVAVQRNAQMKEKAQNDIEFAKYQQDEQFQAIVK